MILTPIKAYTSRNLSVDEHSSHLHRPTSLIGSDNPGSDCKDSASGGMQHHTLPGCEGETGGIPLPEGDIPGQFTKVMGKGEFAFFIHGPLVPVASRHSLASLVQGVHTQLTTLFPQK